MKKEIYVFVRFKAEQIHCPFKRTVVFKDLFYQMDIPILNYTYLCALVFVGLLLLGGRFNSLHQEELFRFSTFLGKKMTGK